MIDLRRLEFLRELDRCGTVAATAAAVHLTPSAVSQQLAALSREAGTAMLEPDGRRVRLTAAAELLLSHAHEVFTHLEHAEADLAAFRRGDAGTVRLGSFTSAMSSIAVPAVAMLAGRSRLRVDIREVQPEEANDALLARHVDVALGLYAGRVPVDEDESRVESRLLIDDIMDVVLPPGHPEAGRSIVDMAALAEEDWILAEPGVPCWQVAVTACTKAGFTPRTRHHINDFGGMAALVAAGQGVGLLPRLAQHFPPQDEVVIRPLSGRPPVRRIALQWRAGTAAQPHIAPLLHALEEVCRSYRAEPAGAGRAAISAVS